MSKFSQVFIFLSNRITFVKENGKNNSLKHFGNNLEFFLELKSSKTFFLFLFFGQTCAQAAKVLWVMCIYFHGKKQRGVHDA
jgi:hypothetical protein